MPEASSTFGSTMPQPMISSQPVCLQTLHPLPPHRLHDTSTSADGSVNGKYGRAHPDLRLFAEHLLGEIQNALFQVGERYVFVDIKSFDLVKNAVRPVRNGLVAEYPPRANHADRRFLTLHRAHLDRTGVRPQQDIRVFADEKRVLHIAGRMLGRKVERREHMPVVLDLGPFGHRIAQPREYVDDFVPYQRDRMPAADRVVRSPDGSCRWPRSESASGRFSRADLRRRVIVVGDACFSAR